MRAIVILAVALAGCVDTVEPEALANIKAACSAGDASACQYMAERADRQRMAVAGALGSVGAGMRASAVQPAYQIPMTQTTRCQQEFTQVVCRTY